MKIEKASEMGFCFGVRRALDLVSKAVQNYGNLQSLGAIVHNQQVVNYLSNMGVTIASGIDELISETVIITSHGVGPQVIDTIKCRGLNIIDTTCPHVKTAQNTACQLANDGYSVIIYGDAGHPEVQGLLGWASGQGSAINDIAALPRKMPTRIGVISQTTQSLDQYIDFTKQLCSRLTEAVEIRLFNTICEATRHRLEAALELAKRVDVMIVVGGSNSANTKRLAETCISQGVDTYHIEKGDDLEASWFRGKSLVGVTAGASTPDRAIEEVISKLENMR